MHQAFPQIKNGFTKNKSKERTGCQLVLPLPRYCNTRCAGQRETPEGARANPMGKRLHVIVDERYKLARRGGSACSRPPRLHPGPTIITFEDAFSYHFFRQIFLFAKNSLLSCFVDPFLFLPLFSRRGQKGGRDSRPAPRVFARLTLQIARFAIGVAFLATPGEAAPAFRLLQLFPLSE